MKHFIITSEKFTGQVTCKYDAQSYLVYFHYEATMSVEQRQHLLIKMPLTIAGFEELVGNSKTLKVEEVHIDLGFDAFWEQYPHKRNRHRCEPLWDKMATKHKLQCLQSIDPYKRYLQRTNIRVKDPEGYLRGKEYLNEWNKLK